MPEKNRLLCQLVDMTSDTAITDTLSPRSTEAGPPRRKTAKTQTGASATSPKRMCFNASRWYDAKMAAQPSLVISCLTLATLLTLHAHANDLVTIEEFVESHCLECHNDSDRIGELSLESFEPSIANTDERWDTTTWERMLKRLHGRQMPPSTATRPSEAEYVSAIEAFESVLDATAEKFPRSGTTDAVRRLNRTEYRNAVRDLLAVNIDVDNLLPSDQISHGFDNVTVGELSPILLSRYIAAAEKIGRLAVGGMQRGPSGISHRIPADRSQESHVEGLPLGTRGGTLFSYHFPANGEYEIQLRLSRDRDENVEGLHEAHDIDVLIDREPIHRFTVKPPEKQKENWQKRDDTLVDANLKKRFKVKGGSHQIGVTFPQKFSSLSEIKRQPFDTNFNRHRHPRLTPAIFEVSIVGPFYAEGPGDTESRRQIFGEVDPATVSPNLAEATAKKVLGSLMRRAYRRPVRDSDTESDFEIPLRFFRERYEADGFEAGIESALATILVNPHFLFRAETTAESASNSPQPITDIELASRLSFFLWSSIPDERTLSLAESGRLAEPETLRQEVRRMLKDSRSQSLVDNFAAQWLYLRNLDSFIPDRRLFPDFDDNLRRAMRRETELAFERILREDRNVLELIRSDSTFLNERLAKHYDIPGVLGSEFRAVELNNHRAHHRGGLLRQASILAVTSYATRTSPTVRGNWILENILGTPAPPPPPNVPALKDKTEKAGVTVRERLAEHRANPACAACHDLMDPIGFALENFDSVGRWRVFDQSEPIDSASTLPGGKQLAGLEDLEQHITEQPEMFVSTLVEKLLTFGLGRGIEPHDGPAIRKVVRESADNDYKFSSLIEGIVVSVPFQMRE